MFGQVVVFLAVASSVAFGATYGVCYPGYGSYVNTVPALTTVCNNGFYGSRILNSGCATPVVSSGVCAIPAFTAVGTPEVIGSCENSFGATGVYGSGYYGSSYGLGYNYGSELNGCRNAVIATTC